MSYITPLLYAFLSSVKQSDSCGSGLFPDTHFDGNPLYIDSNEKDRTPRPDNMGWWGAFGHVEIDGDFVNNTIVKTGTGYTINTTVIYRVEDDYLWGGKEGTPLPLALDPNGKPSLKWLDFVAIPHEWPKSLSDLGQANEFTYYVSWGENLQINVDQSFSIFSVPQDNRYNIALGRR